MTDDKQLVDRAELAKLLVKVGEISADRDEWKVQHENLLAINRKLNEEIAALRRSDSTALILRCRNCGSTNVEDAKPSSDQVLVPREPTEAMIDAGEANCKSWWTPGRTTPVYMNELRYIYRAMLAAAEAEGRKPYAHVIGACPLCGRTDPHSHTSGLLGMS